MEQYEVGQGMFQKKTGEVIRLDDSDESERKVLEYSAFNRIQSEATGHRFLLPAALQVAEGKDDGNSGIGPAKFIYDGVHKGGKAVEEGARNSNHYEGTGKDYPPSVEDVPHDFRCNIPCDRFLWPILDMFKFNSRLRRR